MFCATLRLVAGPTAQRRILAQPKAQRLLASVAGEHLSRGVRRIKVFDTRTLVISFCDADLSGDAEATAANYAEEGTPRHIFVDAEHSQAVVGNGELEPAINRIESRHSVKLRDLDEKIEAMHARMEAMQMENKAIQTQNKAIQTQNKAIQTQNEAMRFQIDELRDTQQGTLGMIAPVAHFETVLEIQRRILTPNEMLPRSAARKRVLQLLSAPHGLFLADKILTGVQPKSTGKLLRWARHAVLQTRAVDGIWAADHDPARVLSLLLAACRPCGLYHPGPDATCARVLLAMYGRARTDELLDTMERKSNLVSPTPQQRKAIRDFFDQHC